MRLRYSQFAEIFHRNYWNKVEKNEWQFPLQRMKKKNPLHNIEISPDDYGNSFNYDYLLTEYLEQTEWGMKRRKSDAKNIENMSSSNNQRDSKLKWIGKNLL